MRALLFILVSLLLSATTATAKDTGMTVVSGKITDSKTKKSIGNVSVTVVGTNIGTVSNADGFFTIKADSVMLRSGIKAQFPGYHNSIVSGSEIKRAVKNGQLEISMKSAAKMLKEVVVKSGDPTEIVRLALGRIPDNYPDRKNMFTAFYRETVQKGKRFIGISEAIMDVYKTPYLIRDSYGERVRIRKGRKLMSQKNSDTLAVKIAGGPNLPVNLDFVKNKEFLFSDEEIPYYDFRMEKPTNLDDRMQFVISFRPRVKVEYPLYEGLLYIDQESLSFSRAEFSLDMSDKSKVTRIILRKKPSGLHFKPQEVSFVVSYKEDSDGISYLNYVSSKMRFKCDWKRRLFSSGFTAYSEMVMVDRRDNPETGISGKTMFRKNDIFDDKVNHYRDPDFWKDYNIIEPTVSLEKAVERLLVSLLIPADTRSAAEWVPYE